MRSPSRSQHALSLLLPLMMGSALGAQSWAQRNPAVRPQARDAAPLVYDEARSSTLMFGGFLGGNLAAGDMWRWDGNAWSQLQASSMPAARWGHAISYDPLRSVVVLHGGFLPGVGFASDTWEWDGVAWSPRTIAIAPGPRGNHGMVFDATRGRHVLFGGASDNGAYLGDTWEYDGGSWTRIPGPVAPSPRRGAAMAFDSIRGEVALFGGGNATAVLRDTWAYRSGVWQQRNIVGGPAARQDASFAFDLFCGRAVMVGGADPFSATQLGDSWTWDGATWSQIGGTQPAPRSQCGLAFDVVRRQSVLFGGIGATMLSDTWVFSGGCNRTMATVQTPRVGSSAVFRYDYPSRSGAGDLYVHMLSLPFVGSQAVSVPGFTSLGLARCDLNSILLTSTGLLGDSGQQPWRILIPADAQLLGLDFDVQTVDVSLATNTIFWSDNDIEAEIGPAIAPVADFVATPTSGPLPLLVRFDDRSTNGPATWQWDFDDDGVVDSTEPNPTFTYTTAGFHSVRCTVSNVAGSSSRLRVNYVLAGALPNPQLELALIDAGTFQMGSADVGGIAAPAHPVTITRPFWIGKYEVTQSRYQAVIGSNPSFFQGSAYPDSAQRPVEQVTWNQAMAYCAALNATESAAGRILPGYHYRLPTEAEWEYCCRAGTTTEWSTGASITASQANFSNPLGRSNPVGSYAANTWGLFDMHGNVWEWCLDAWGTAANYPSIGVTDPYSGGGSMRMLRGGYWFATAATCRSSFRAMLAAGSAYNSLGFRVVLAPILAP